MRRNAGERSATRVWRSDSTRRLLRRMSITPFLQARKTRRQRRHGRCTEGDPTRPREMARPYVCRANVWHTREEYKQAFLDFDEAIQSRSHERYRSRRPCSQRRQRRRRRSRDSRHHRGDPTRPEFDLGVHRAVSAGEIRRNPAAGAGGRQPGNCRQFEVVRSVYRSRRPFDSIPPILTRPSPTVTRRSALNRTRRRPTRFALPCSAQKGDLGAAIGEWIFHPSPIKITLH